MDFLHEIHRAYFFFGDDKHGYLEQLCKAILDVTDADKELQVLTDPAEKNRCWDKRDAAFQRGAGGGVAAHSARPAPMNEASRRR
jgi:hypothetical protein